MKKASGKKHSTHRAYRKTAKVSAVSGRRHHLIAQGRDPHTAPSRSRRTTTRGPSATAPAKFDPNDLAPPPSSGLADNLLKESVRAKDLDLSVPFGPRLELEDTVFISTLGTDGRWVDHQADGVNPTNYDEPVIVPFKAAWRLLDGTNQFRYRFYYKNNDNYEDGPIQSYVRDTLPPGIPDLSPPKFNFSTETDALTPDKLDADGNLPVHIYGYSFSAADDTIYLGLNDDESDPFLVRVQPGPGDSIDLLYPKAMLDKLNDGVNQFWYRVVDRAGNPSPKSVVAVVTTLLRSAIDDLEPLDIPAMSDGLVTIEDIEKVDANGVTGLELTIPNHAKYIPGSNYSVRLIWGIFRSETIKITPSGDDPILYITFPYTLCYAIWKSLSDASGDKTVTDQVHYEVLVDGHVVGIAPPTDVVANFDVPGGEDPDPEKPGNPKLFAPELQSASADTPNNAIPLPDSGKDATVFVATRTNEAPSEAVFVADDRLEIRFRKPDASVPDYVVVHLVTAAEASGTDPIEETLLGAELLKFGTGTMWLDYVVYREVGEDADGNPIENRAVSPIRDIPVNGPGDLPGDGFPLDKLIWIDPPRDPAIGADTIGPCQAARYVNFRVPDYSNRHAGDKITLTLALYNRLEHTNPGELPIDGRVFTRTAEVPPDLGPVIFQFGELELMVYDELGGFAMHTHIKYEVLGTQQPPGSDPVRSGEDLILKVDSRGDRPTPDKCAPEWGGADSGVEASGDCGCGCGGSKRGRRS